MAQVKLRGPALLGRAQEELGSAREIALGNGLAFNGNTIEASGIVLTGPQGPTGATGATGADGASGTSIYAFDVTAYGAVGDGSTNDTVAIQAAITAASTAGGGVVYIPTGTYHIRPASSTAEYALTVDHSDIVVMGDGPGLTKLVFHHYDGTAGTNYHLVAGAVLRGHGIFINGGHENITFKDFELDGGAPKTDNTEIPANPGTGNGWDITHKGIYFEINEAHDKMTVRNCTVHSFRGEMIYYGGNLLERLDIIGCTLYDTNASGISVSGTNLNVFDNEFYDCYSDAAECGYFSGRNVFARNYLHDCYHNGFSILPVGGVAGPWGFAEIFDNYLLRCGTNVSGQQPAMYLGGPRNMRVFNNILIDCPGFPIYLDCNDSYGQSDNVEVYNNRIVADADSVNSIIYISTGNNNPAKRIHIHHNTGVTTQVARDNGEVIRRSVNLDENGSPGNVGVGSLIYDNYLMDGSQDSTEQWKTAAFLTTTSLTTINSMNDIWPFYTRRCEASWKVLNADTVLALTLDFFYGGVAQTIILASGSQTVGHHSATANFFGSGVVKVNATAGTANNIIVLANITDR